MKRLLTMTALVATILAVYACDSNSPSGTPTPPAGALIIDVLRENGALSFSPNPATVPAGQIVSWHNVDNITHRVVLNDGTLDTGNITAGTFSAPMTLGAVGYHCSIHPSMVGTIVR